MSEEGYGVNRVSQPPSRQHNSYEAELIDVVDDLMLHQHVSTPTRIRIGQNAPLLDILLTKFPDTLSDVRVLPPLTKSDHASV